MRRPLLPWLAGLGLAAIATGACLAIEPLMSTAGLAMVYLLAGIFASLVLDRGPAMLASAACVTALNYFFVPPRYSFRVDGVEYWWTLAVLLGLSVGTGEMIARLRERTARARAGEARSAQLHELGEALAETTGPEAMAVQAAEWLNDRLAHPCAAFIRGDENSELRCFCAGASQDAFHPASARWAMEHGRPLGRGCPDWPDLPLWCAPFAARDAAGAVQVLLPARMRPDADTLQQWEALARQAGLAIERERASSRAREADDAARAEAARNTLLASLSHDLRTPLAAIVGCASTLRTHGGSLAPQQREQLLANLENEARDMTLMADNILQMARLSQPQWPLRTQWESVEELLGAAVQRMRRRWEGARIRLACAADLPPVQAEAALIAQVLANLVDNAMRHSATSAEVIVTAGRSRDGVFIAVRDHGQGLPADAGDDLFERYRADGNRGGAGLGLAICKLIVEAHGGRIAAKRCEPGAEFRIDLPAASQQSHG